MRALTVLTFAGAIAVAPPVLAQITQAIDDLAIYDLLAPCAASGLFWPIYSAEDHPSCSSAASEGDPEFQSCLCSNSDVASELAKNISASVSSECGSAASDDQRSASRVLEKYCNPGETTITFDTPTENIVTQYITDIDKMNFLAPCASSDLSWAVMYSVRKYLTLASHGIALRRELVEADVWL